MIEQQTVAATGAQFPSITWSEFRGDTRGVVPRDELFAVLTFLRNARGFDLLVDITCVDYLNYRDAEDRFGLVYLLSNTADERIDHPAHLRE